MNENLIQQGEVGVEEKEASPSLSVAVYKATDTSITLHIKVPL